MSEEKQVIILKKSPIGCSRNHRNCLKALGLKRVNQRREVKNTPAVLGLINKIRYLLGFEESKV